ncbi:MAG: tyrosine-type recombinase/integrase [Mangrovibacterium sp.]
MAIKVTLRRKYISGKRQSLYLDFYPPISKDGQSTRREFLNMYVSIDKKELKKEIDEKELRGANVDQLKKLYQSLKKLSPIDEKDNEETIKLAESILQKRKNELNKPEIYSAYEKEQLRIKELGQRSFLDYFEKLANQRAASNYDNWVSALKYLKSFAGKDKDVRFCELNERYFNEFKEYLLTTKGSRRKENNLATNTAVSYFNKVKAALRQAFKDGILQIDLNSRIAPIKQEDTQRGYLTLEELNKLVQVPCNDPLLKRAALFSALTGLRFSDIQKLKWNEIAHVDGQGYFLNFRQKKTKGIETLPISEQAYSLCGDPGEPDSKVFEGLTYSAYANKHLFHWIGAAGITKDITFHSFRHTYATLQLFNGTDIFTVSKMLGHKSLKTTQIYAHIVDEAKRKAADSIKLDFK